MLKQHQNANYFWRTLRVWLGWLGAAAVAWAALKTQLLDLFRGLQK